MMFIIILVELHFVWNKDFIICILMWTDVLVGTNVMCLDGIHVIWREVHVCLAVELKYQQTFSRVTCSTFFSLWCVYSSQDFVGVAICPWLSVVSALISFIFYVIKYYASYSHAIDQKLCRVRCSLCLCEVSCSIFWYPALFLLTEM